jgi:hypothetical protein
VGKTAATGGGMRRGSASPTAKPSEKQGLETPREKTPRLLTYLLRISFVFLQSLHPFEELMILDTSIVSQQLGTIRYLSILHNIFNSAVTVFMASKSQNR